MNSATSKKPSLDDWLDLIRQQEMPIFDQTARRVLALSGDTHTTMPELAGVILQDASMTARVLKLANSVLYTPSTTTINTVTRAVIVLGFNIIRNICLTLTLVDTLAQGETKERVARELGRAIHAAMQARGLAKVRRDKSPEEVFIATLLYRLGELAFWCFGGEHAERIERLMTEGRRSPEQAQEQVLGFRLTLLTRQLIQSWHLTELLREATQDPRRKDPRIRTIVLAHQVAGCAETHGWNSEQMESVIEQAAKLTGMSPKKTQNLLLQSAHAAAEMAADVGASFAVPYIPQPQDDANGPSDDDGKEQTPRPGDADQGMAPERDPKLLVEILVELESILKGDGCSFNVIMELVLEGIFKGVGVDRVVFALTTPDKATIKAKYVLGADRDDLSKRFDFNRPSRGEHILFQTLDHKHPYFIDARMMRANHESITDVLSRLVTDAPFMTAPIVIDNQSIGLFYADRALSKRPLERLSFDEFRHLVHRASIGLMQASAHTAQSKTQS